MFIQGDVLATISLLIGTCVSVWALTITYGLLFPERSEIAKDAVSAQPWQCVGRGVAIVLTAGLLGVVLVNIPNPLVKLLGWVAILGILCVAGLGLSGIARSAGEHLTRMAPDMSNYAAFSRGAALMIVGCVVPVVGWLAFGPLLFLAAVGAGSRATFGRMVRSTGLSHMEVA
ncbi:MAG: hypothetical protein P4L46_16440 [Fimbriimonas sp.]|nr:hypothetical protein [Fimbriimonas sp.]